MMEKGAMIERRYQVQVQYQKGDGWDALAFPREFGGTWVNTVLLTLKDALKEFAQIRHRNGVRVVNLSSLCVVVEKYNDDDGD